VFSIVTRLWAGRSEFRSPAEAECPGAHPASYSMANGGFLPGIMRPEREITHLCLVARLMMIATIASYMPSWHVLGQVYLSLNLFHLLKNVPPSGKFESSIFVAVHFILRYILKFRASRCCDMVGFYFGNRSTYRAFTFFFWYKRNFLFITVCV
jgi:hypothetical protein